MLKRLQNLAKREASGALSGKQLEVGRRTVKVDRLLGEGGFATIYHCTDLATGQTFALKHFVLGCGGSCAGSAADRGPDGLSRERGTAESCVQRCCSAPTAARLPCSPSLLPPPPKCAAATLRRSAMLSQR